MGENQKNPDRQEQEKRPAGGADKKREPYKFVPVDTPEAEVPDEKLSRIASVMREFHRGTWWEADGGQMAQLALEDTYAKITNYYVLHDEAWTHGNVEDFVSMDEGTGKYMVYVLCSDGVVLQIPDKELDEPEIVIYKDTETRMIPHMPKRVRDVDALADRILAEKDRILALYEKN